MKQLSFGSRLFVILLFFALLPSLAVLGVGWAATNWLVLPFASSAAAWDSVAASGARALAVARQEQLSAQDSAAIRAHEEALSESLTRSMQARYALRRGAVGLAVLSVVAMILVVLVASRVAGHLSRNLSRPVQELVGWTEIISAGGTPPDGPAARGAPEFEQLRNRMREMSAQIQRGRRAALEAERLEALREAARQVAHELKNPLTPIKFAVERLRREAPSGLHDTVDVLSTEAARLEEMARSFAQFGRLPEGPLAPVDVAELARYTARSSVPSQVPLEINVSGDLPLIQGHYEALARALANVMLNAVEACKDGGSITVDVERAAHNGGPAVVLSVRDTGCGIPPNRLAKIWEPYVTYKAGGTGLGLAIARQTVLAHHGEVAAESSPGKGTLIRFTLPASQLV